MELFFSIVFIGSGPGRTGHLGFGPRRDLAGVGEALEGGGGVHGRGGGGGGLVVLPVLQRFKDNSCKRNIGKEGYPGWPDICRIILSLLAGRIPIYRIIQPLLAGRIRYLSDNLSRFPALYRIIYPDFRHYTGLSVHSRKRI